MRRFFSILLLLVVVASGSLDPGTQLLSKNKKRVARRTKTQNTKKDYNPVAVSINQPQQPQGQPTTEPLQLEQVQPLAPSIIEDVQTEAHDTTTVATPEARVEKVKCPECYITPGKCIRCYGSGKETVMIDMKTSYVTCTACNGTGVCPTCHGTKMVKKK